MDSPKSHTWTPLEDLSSADLGAASDELPALAATWQEECGRLEPHQVAQFNERLEREWAIETGILEKLYSLDRGTTQLLIERGIDASLIGHDDTDQSPDFIAGIIGDQQQAVHWLFGVVKQERPLSTSFVKELHALMTGRQTHAEGIDSLGRATKVEMLHGDYKAWPNNPTRPDGSLHEYCPPVHVAAEMDRLVQLHAEHEASRVAPEVEAAWLHHRFTQIHPFQDGNGRVARALASLVLIRAGWFPLVVTRDDRVRYLDALEAADAGDLTGLIELFVTVEKRSFVKALSIAEQVHEDAGRLDQMIDAISDMFGTRDQRTRDEFDQAKSTAHAMWEVANRRFSAVKDSLDDKIGRSFTERRIFADHATNDASDKRIWNRYQVVDTAKRLDYFANAREFHEWSRLGLVTESGRSEILLSFHGVGQEYRGLIGASMCFYRRQEADDIEHQIIELQPVSDELFQINYKEAANSVERRFRTWLDVSLIKALDQWRRSE